MFTEGMTKHSCIFSGDTIEWAYNLNIKDNALPVGRSLKPNDHRFRTPSVAVYIA